MFQKVTGLILYLGLPVGFVFVHSFAMRRRFNLIKAMVWFTGLARPAG
jgi:hypothetical protein